MVNIKISNLSLKYKNKEIFKNINLNIKKGEFVIILGKNSSGKTTLLNLIKGNIKGEGEILINGINNYDVKENITILSGFTNFYSKTILDELLFTKNNIKSIKKILKDFNMYKYINKSPQDLTYFQKQKLSIIKCILKGVEIILIDGTLSYLNNHEKIELISIIKKYQMENNITIICTTTNLNDITFCDRLFIIDNKFKIIEVKQEKIFIDDKLKKLTNINIPLFYDLVDKLRLYGLIDDNISNIDEMVDQICS